MSQQQQQQQQAQDTSVSLVSENEYSSVPASSSLDSFISLVGLRAPKFENEEMTARVGMDLVAVLDRSGSMAGQKMEMLHHTIKLLIENLKDADKLSLVSYDNTVETNLPLTQMDKAGKERARAELAKIKDRGSTNLSGGLFAGLEILKERREGKNEIASVLLLTDGLANAGITDPAQLVAETQRLQATISNPTSIYCFGVGADHNSNLLTELAKGAHGTYYFLKTTDSIPLAFGDCLGGLMSVIAQNIKLTVTAAEGVEVNNISTNFAVTVDQPGKQYTLDIGDLFSEEERDILVDIKVAAVAGPTPPQPLLLGRVRYLNVISAQTEDREVVVQIERSVSEQVGQVSLKVDQERNRLRTAKAMEDAKVLGEAGKLQEAQDLLGGCQQAILSSVSAAVPASAMLVQDIFSVQQKMQTERQFREEGHHRLQNKMHKHYMQRACEADEEEVQHYATRSKMAAKKAFF